MLEVERVKYNAIGNKVCWLCGNHYNGDTESCPDCDKFWGEYAFSPGKVHVFRVNGNVFRVYYENDINQVLNYLKTL